MSYLPRKQLSGLGGAESCGPTQQWDPNFVFAGIKGQCTPAGSPMTPGAGQSIGDKISGGVADFFKVLSASKTAAPPAPIIIQAPSRGGISTTTLVVAGGAALLLVAILASRK
jgi:hypothetical protein